MTRQISQDFVIPEHCRGQRLDKTLANLLPDYSRSQLKTSLREGAITIDGSRPAPRTIMQGGEVVKATLQAVEQVSEVEPQRIPLTVMHEDEAILVIAKPVGLVMHPGAGNPDGTLQNGLLYEYPELSTLPRAGIVHRLDKDTSGLIAIARTQSAYDVLVAALAEREVTREYEAVVGGVMTAGGSVDAPIGRHPVDRKRMAVRDEGRHAVTHYRVLERFFAHTHVKLNLESGRTHQIRVHMQHIRHPVIGDPVYGRRLALPARADEQLVTILRSFKRQALHARRLGLDHPVSGEYMEWQTPAPDDFQALVTALHADNERRDNDK